MKKISPGILAVLAILVLCLYLFGPMIISFGFIGWYDNLTGGDPPVPSANEVVMPPNSSIEATTATGKIHIKSGSGLKRYYTWEGATRHVIMWPRESEWQGSIGLYYPGPGRHWFPPHEGLSRGVLEEGVQHFGTLAAALKWIEERSYGGETVYRDDGLLVFYGKVLSRAQLNVSVWQILVDGKKPTTLPGSNNSAIAASWDKE